jgi:hypothetical protein
MPVGGGMDDSDSEDTGAGVGGPRAFRSRAVDALAGSKRVAPVDAPVAVPKKVESVWMSHVAHLMWCLE